MLTSLPSTGPCVGCGANLCCCCCHKGTSMCRWRGDAARGVEQMGVVGGKGGAAISISVEERQHNYNHDDDNGDG